MNYTLHQLSVFLKVCEYQSITKAAEALHLTQPAVSIQLRNFQDQFEAPLTEVVGRKLYITAFGTEIARSAERILRETEGIRSRALAWAGLLAGSLSISVVSTGKYVMPYFLGDFLNRHAGINLNMDVTNKAAVIRSLERNEVDFSLMSMLPDNLQVESISLMPNTLMLVCGRDREVPETLTDEWLSAVPHIFREQGSATRLAMERFFRERGIHSPKRLTLTSNEAVKQAVVAGLGFSVMPLIGLRHELASGHLRLLDFPGLPLRTQWHLTWLSRKQLSPAAEAFLAHIRSHKADITTRYFDWLKEGPQEP